MSVTLHTLVFAMGVGRVILGLAPHVAAGPAARAFTVT